ncbi:uncharacterized protein LOC121979894 [Zingiber officinale]|uniref:uncharacterized protein LOC121979894 n=1 Tax=Zingiber officinale TaxID=94328 RepID=UPI001C4C72B4|nr:uncharacterized protein LOC121979894 [Zingiber officinale]
MVRSKTVVTDLVKGEKLNGDNYGIWHLKIQLLFEDQELIEVLKHEMQDSGEGNTPQARRDQEAYRAWKKKDSQTRAILLSSMHDDLIPVYEQFSTVISIWQALKERLGSR